MEFSGQSDRDRGAPDVNHYDVLIVGAGHGGAQAAIALRQAKFPGTIGIVGAESELPYERPLLSKDYLAGEKSFKRILIRPEAFWMERQINFVIGCAVNAVDPVSKTVVLDDDRKLSYQNLIWAAGGRARQLTCEGAEAVGVHTVRTRADVDRLIGELPFAKTIVIVGGGYIGLETASAMIKFGKRVVLIEAFERVLARVAGLEISKFYEREHRANGVDIRLGMSVEFVETKKGKVSGVRFANGETLECQMVVVGIGINPAIGPLQTAGASCGNGVNVDSRCRTSLPHVFAIGDCAAHPNIHADGAAIRVESVQNANDMAKTVAKAIIFGDQAPAYEAVPWFWSNQYDLKLQTVGLSIGYDETVMRGDPSTRSFSLIYLKAGRVIALDCVNAAKDYAQGKRLIDYNIDLDREALADTNVTLKDYVIRP